MIDHVTAEASFRSRMLTAVAATTGAITMSATGTTFVRASGSFLTNGFEVGMEVVGAGMDEAANQEPSVVRAVAALTLTVDRTLTTEASGAGKTLTAGIPRVRLFDNMEAQDGVTPLTDGAIVGRPYVKDFWTPQPLEKLTTSSDGGTLQEEGIYTVQIFGLQGFGSKAIRRLETAILSKFTPGTELIIGLHVVRVQGGPSGPSRGQLVELDDSAWTLCEIDVPWRAYPTNTIAA